MKRKLEVWTVGTRVFIEFNGEKRYATVTDVIPHDSGNPWVNVESDDGGITAGTQKTLMSYGVKKVEKQ